ncbi:MAG: hypothetical protein KDC24_14190, partial [Saprospiraceae bacterium]|nr:hypothetical protein [Saprospiraceae bacterium]
SEGSLLAQASPGLSFLTVNDGLSQGMIFDILQSKDGFIWIATKDGLNRYDGARFVTYSTNPFNPFAISSSEIWALHEDQKGRIWILSIDRLDMLEPESGRFFHITSNGERFHGIKIAETPDGGLWFAGEEHISKLEIREDAIENAIKEGTGIVEGKWKTFRIDENRLPPGKPMGPGPIIFTRDQKMLIGTHTGVEQLDLVSEKFSPIFESHPFYVICMAESPNGAIQVKGNLNMGGQRWVEISGDSTRSFIDQQSAYPRSRFIYDKEGNFWTFRDWKIQKWNPDSFFSGGKPLVEIQGNTLGVNKSQAGTEYMIDKSGLIWVGTSGYGLIKIDENGPKFKTFLPGVSHRILLEDPDGGIYTSWFPDKKFTDKTFEKSVPNEKFKSYQYQTESNVTFAKDGSVWLLENWENRLSRQDVPSETKTYYPFDGLTLLTDKKGYLVSVNEEGLHRFNIKTKSADHFPFATPIPKLSEVSKYLYEDSEGTLWIFGLTGLVKAVPTSIGYDYTQFINDTKNPSSLCFNTVTCAVDDPIEPERYLWLGTKGGGLSRLDKKAETFKQYTRDHGLPDNVVYGLLAEDHHGTRHAPGYIWLSTNKGLCRFDVREEKTRNFSAADGLQNNEFNSASYLKTKDGTLIFGGINGLNVFHPDSLHFNENLPTIHIVGLSVDNIPVSTVGFGKKATEGGSRLQFAHDQNLFNFEFAALEFTNPSQNQYKYQLLGFDQQWV